MFAVDRKGFQSFKNEIIKARVHSNMHLSFQQKVFQHVSGLSI